jgi:flagellar basal body P-ring formation protein FlgA
MVQQSTSFLPAAGFAGALLLGGGLSFAAGIELPVPSVTIYPGDVIGGNLMEDRSFEMRDGEMLAVFKDRGGLEGKIARRTLAAGKPIPLNAVREVDVISQGKPVSIIFQAGGLTITGQGIPLQPGKVGDLLSVRNVDSGMVIKGIVQADGTIRVSGP